MLALSYVAAKSTNDAIGIDQSDENAGGAQLLAETVTDQPHAAVPAGLALPFVGHLRPEALLPVVVQPQLVSGAAYTPPFSGAAHGLPNPLAGRILCGRGGP